MSAPRAVRSRAACQRRAGHASSATRRPTARQRERAVPARLRGRRPPAWSSPRSTARVIHANRAFCELVGCAADRARRPPLRRLHPPRRPRRRRRRPPPPVAGEIDALRHRKRYVPPDRRARLGRAALLVRRATAAGSPPHMTAQVAGHHRPQARRGRGLRASEQRYRTLVDHLPDTIVAIYDRDFRCTSTWAASMFERLGWQPERILGKTIDEALPPEHGRGVGRALPRRVRRACRTSSHYTSARRHGLRDQGRADPRRRRRRRRRDDASRAT